MIKKALQSSLFRSTGIYLLGNVINSAVPFLLLPILTRYLTPEEYGVVAMFTVVTACAGAIAAMGVHGAVSRMYFDYDPAEFAAFVGNCLMVQLVGIFLVGVALYLAAPGVSRVSAIPVDWLWTVLIVAAGQAVCNIVLAVWQARTMAMSYGVFQISSSLLNACASIILVAGMDMGWRGRVLGQVLATLVATLAAVHILFRSDWATLRFDGKHIRTALRYGGPLVFHVIGGIALSMADRVIITNVLTIAETGLYAVAAQIAMVINFLIDAFNRAYAPWLFEQLKSGSQRIRRQIVKGTYLYFVVILAVALTFSVAASLFLDVIVGEQFVGGGQYIFWLSLAAAFTGMYYMVTLYIQFQKRTELLAGITLLVGGFNVLICYWLVSWRGGIGAAQAAVIAQLMMFLVTWIVAARVIDMNWTLKERSAGTHN